VVRAAVDAGRVHDRVALAAEDQPAVDGEGDADGEFRTEPPADWQLTVFYALTHAAGDDVRAGRADAETALEAVTTSLRALILAPASAQPV
jgi:hypothetical protein